MANYPTSDPSFTDKSPGQTIASAHMDAVQDEVVAIGSALRGTLQHGVSISTGGLTVSTGNTVLGQNLSVAGNSTFAGAATFSSGVTFAQAPAFSTGISISTGVVRQNSLPAWNVFHSTHVALAGASSQGLLFDSEHLLRGTVAHSTATNSSRITINTTGVYQVQYRGQVQTDGAVTCSVHLRFNDASTAVLSEENVANSSGKHILNLGGPVHVANTGYFTIVVENGTQASTHGSSAQGVAARFMGVFLG